MIHLRPTPSGQVAHVWAEVKPFIAAAHHKSRSLMTVDECLVSLMDRSRQLWVITEPEIAGCIITEVYDTARGLTCAMPVAAGKDEHITPCLAQIEAWARAEGCVRMEFVGRPGWSRRMARYGWTTQQVILEKVL